MQRTFAALSLVLAAACASGGAAPGRGAPMTQTISVAGSAGTNSMSIDGSGSAPTTHTVNAAVDRVWRIMPATFDSLGVPVTRMDQAQKVIGNEGFKIRQRLKNVALSRYIDCGQTQIGPNADSYEVHMTLLVQVRPVSGAATSSSIVTTFEAAARPLTFSQGYSRCTSTATLERRLLEVINAQLK